MHVSRETIDWATDKLAESFDPDYISWEEGGEYLDQEARQQWLNSLVFLRNRVEVEA